MPKKTAPTHNNSLLNGGHQQSCLNVGENASNLQEDLTMIYSSNLKHQGGNHQGTSNQRSYYITIQMHNDGHRHEKCNRESNRKLSELLATNQLLSIAGTDKIQDRQSQKRSIDRSKSGSRSRSFKNITKNRAYAEFNENKAQIIHGVYNRSHLSSQHSAKENNKALRELDTASRNWNKMSNFERLKQEAQKLERSNVVLNLKEQGDHQQRKSSAKQLSIKQCFGSGHKVQNNSHTKTQRYRFKQNLTNRYRNNEKGASMHNTMTDMKSYYHHINSQIHNRSTHKLSTEGEAEVSVGTENRQPADLIEGQADRAEFLRKGSMKNHSKSASEWNIYKKYSNSKDQKQRKDSFLNSKAHRQEQSNLSNHGHLSNQVGAETNHASSNVYMINNEFIPMVNRSILDKNRQNIKKISKNVNRILSTKYSKNAPFKISNSTHRCSTVGDETNQNIDEFIKTKMSILDLTTSYDRTYNRIGIGLQSTQHKPYSNNRAENEQTTEDLIEEVKCQKTVKRNLSTNKNSKSTKKINSQSDLLRANQKIDTTNAAKFYKPQLEKYKGKAGVMIIDPHLKAKAIQISAKQIKKNNDIVIICL